MVSLLSYLIAKLEKYFKYYVKIQGMHKHVFSKDDRLFLKDDRLLKKRGGVWT